MLIMVATGNTSVCGQRFEPEDRMKTEYISYSTEGTWFSHSVIKISFDHCACNIWDTFLEIQIPQNVAPLLVKSTMEIVTLLQRRKDILLL